MRSAQLQQRMAIRIWNIFESTLLCIAFLRNKMSVNWIIKKMSAIKVVRLNLYFWIKINFTKIQMILVVENCLWNPISVHFEDLALYLLTRCNNFLGVSSIWQNISQILTPQSRRFNNPTDNNIHAYVYTITYVPTTKKVQTTYSDR